MKETTLRCNNCGTSLSVKRSIKFFNCTACGSSLTIEESGNARYAAVVGPNAKNVRTAGNSAKILQLENEIARLDREWTLDREQYKIRGKYSSELPGNNTIPFTIIVAILAVGFIVFWLNQVSYIGEKSAAAGHDSGSITPIFLFFGVVAIIGVIINSVVNVNKSSEYEEAKKIYENKRSALINKLNQMKR